MKQSKKQKNKFQHQKYMERGEVYDSEDLKEGPTSKKYFVQEAKKI